MGDAAEVLSALYEKLAAVAAKTQQPSLLDDNFGLHVKVNLFHLLAGRCLIGHACRLLP